MKYILRKIVSQQLINIFYHYPKGLIANLRFLFPSRKLKIIGVTGTDGKTTTVNMIHKILKDAGRKVSMISTINAVIAGKEFDTGFHVTSPDPFMVQKFASMAVDNKDEYLVLEVTSHALDQGRFLGITFDVGVVTNITHDHLDYHHYKENYFSAKAKLIKKAKYAVLNGDEKHFKKLSKLTAGRVVSFGFSKFNDFNPQKFPLNLKVPGRFNYLNALASASVAVCLGIDKNSIKKSLNSFSGLKGRFEEIGNNRRMKVIIDFAHTPNALENVLKLIKQEKKGKVISVFGAAGKRDESKRALMGRVVAELSDYVVITAEDPRGELEKINKMILAGSVRGGGVLDKNLFIIEDRAEAIDFAINKLARAGDTVGIFGKGHETSMNLDGKTEIAWSDTETVKKSLERVWKKN